MIACREKKRFQSHLSIGPRTSAATSTTLMSSTTGSRLVRDDLSVKLPAQSRSGGVRLMCSERMNVRGQSANGFQYNGEVGRTNGLWTAWQLALDQNIEKVAPCLHCLERSDRIVD